MIIYQLHYKNEDRAYHNFKTEDEATTHQERLIRFIKGKIGAGLLGYHKYLEEARNLKVVKVEVKRRNKMFSVVEYGFSYSSVVKTFFEREHAEIYLKKIREDSTLRYEIMESAVNDHERKNNFRER